MACYLCGDDAYAPRFIPTGALPESLKIQLSSRGSIRWRNKWRMRCHFCATARASLCPEQPLVQTADMKARIALQACQGYMLGWKVFLAHRASFSFLQGTLRTGAWHLARWRNALSASMLRSLRKSRCQATQAHNLRCLCDVAWPSCQELFVCNFVSAWA